MYLYFKNLRYLIAQKLITHDDIVQHVVTILTSDANAELTLNIVSSVAFSYVYTYINEFPTGGLVLTISGPIVSSYLPPPFWNVSYHSSDNLNENKVQR